MTELTAIPTKMQRSVSDLDQLCTSNADLQPLITQPVFSGSNEVLKAFRIASRLLPRSYNPAIPESKQQGVLSILHDLYSWVTEYTGYSEVSLAVLDSRKAIFSSLAMVQKYHRHKQLKRSYVLLCNVEPAVAEILSEFEYEIRWIEPELIEQHLDDQCAAVVVSLPGLKSNWSYLNAVRASLDDWDIPLIADGAGQYLLPANHKQDVLKADILHMDLAYICGLDNGVNAVLSNSRFARYLPVPVIAKDDQRFRWLTVAEHPYSIGPLYSCPVNLQAAMHCLVYLRLQGSEAIQQQAIQSMVIACYLQMELSIAGLEVVVKAEASGDLTVMLEDSLENTRRLQSLVADLAMLPLKQRLVLDTKHHALQFSVTWLHQLNLKQVDQLLEMFILHLGKNNVND
jgi:glycine cleavage system protein P-like pyridoxal-binding family